MLTMTWVLMAPSHRPSRSVRPAGARACEVRRKSVHTPEAGSVHLLRSSRSAWRVSADCVGWGGACTFNARARSSNPPVCAVWQTYPALCVCVGVCVCVCVCVCTSTSTWSITCVFARVKCRRGEPSHSLRAEHRWLDIKYSCRRFVGAFVPLPATPGGPHVLQDRGVELREREGGASSEGWG